MSGDGNMFGALVSSIGTYRRASDTSRALRMQGEMAARDAFANEEAQRRDASQLAGAQAAAMAQAGGGAGGTNELVARQSAVLAELDALNIRYSGLTKRAASLSEARATKREGAFLAGAQLLAGSSKSSSNRLIQAMGG